MRWCFKKNCVEVSFQILKNIYKNKKGTTGEIELGVHVLSLLNSDSNLGSYLYAPKIKYKNSVFLEVVETDSSAYIARTLSVVYEWKRDELKGKGYELDWRANINHVCFFLSVNNYSQPVYAFVFVL
jgi:hypothetical protein